MGEDCAGGIGAESDGGAGLQDLAGDNVLGLGVWRDGLIVDGDWCGGVCISGRGR